MSCVNQTFNEAGLSKDELLDLLRKKVLCEVETLMTRLGKGYRPDVDFILSEIYLIDTLSRSGSNLLDQNFSLYALQYYLNNEWQAS